LHRDRNYIIDRKTFRRQHWQPSYKKHKNKNGFSFFGFFSGFLLTTFYKGGAYSESGKKSKYFVMMVLFFLHVHYIICSRL